MPKVDFEGLPDSARVWVYGADRKIDEESEKELIGSVDEFLSGWRAHGAPLYSARDWSDGRFLTIAVDQEQEGASGCSIDGLFRTLKSMEPTLGAQLVPSGLVYFRGKDGNVQASSRDEFSAMSSRGDVDSDTEVFDLSVTTLGEWRGRFRSKAANSWHSALMSERV